MKTASLARARLGLPLLLLALLAACGSEPTRPPAPSSPSSTPARPPATSAPSRPQTESSAATQLLATAQLLAAARADLAAGKLESADATLERALRIEPRNPWLWHELARVRLKEGKTAQAEALVARSNNVAGDDAPVRAANAKLLDEARRVR